jgi:hypothetical protein
VEKKIEKGPGPGSYNIKDSPLKQAPSYGFGSSPQRDPISNNKVPGPGIYKIPCEITKMPDYTGARSKDFGYV